MLTRHATGSEKNTDRSFDYPLHASIIGNNEATRDRRNLNPPLGRNALLTESGFSLVHCPSFPIVLTEH